MQDTTPPTDYAALIRDGLTEDGLYLRHEVLRRIESGAVVDLGDHQLLTCLKTYAEVSAYASYESCGKGDPLWVAYVRDSPVKKGFCFRTSGWSGAEDLIEAIRGSVGWILLWQMSTRGGSFYFSEPLRTKEEIRQRQIRLESHSAEIPR